MEVKRKVAEKAGIEVVQFLPEDLSDLRGAFEERVLARLRSSGNE